MTSEAQIISFFIDQIVAPALFLAVYDVRII
ncbi:hypothetical protein ACVWXO_000753 [Bradyrhizobium sp. LM2.7]